jgi:hypothetical protein
VRRRRKSAELPEVLTVLDGIGRLLMSIDARLAEVVNLLRDDDEEADT